MKAESVCNKIAKIRNQKFIKINIVYIPTFLREINFLSNFVYYKVYYKVLEQGLNERPRYETGINTRSVS